jgi:hypothetical protein
MLKLAFIFGLVPNLGVKTVMNNNQVYRGNCHCGAYRFEVDLVDPISASSCNCSLCSKLGALWGFVASGSVNVTKGDKTNLKTYHTSGVTIKVCGH